VLTDELVPDMVLAEPGEFERIIHEAAEGEVEARVLGRLS
jgi:hypothetical protein